MAPALGAGARVGGLVGGLPLRVLLALHPPVLEPDLDLSLGQIQIPRQLPSAKGNWKSTFLHIEDCKAYK